MCAHRGRARWGTAVRGADHTALDYASAGVSHRGSRAAPLWELGVEDGGLD